MIVKPSIAVVGVKLVPETKVEAAFIEQYRDVILYVLTQEFLGAPDTPDTEKKMHTAVQIMFNSFKGRKKRRKVEK